MFKGKKMYWIIGILVVGALSYFGWKKWKDKQVSGTGTAGH